MHGRIKVKTTAEQAEEKRKEREKKLKLFQKASTIALDKIEKKEYGRVGLDVTQRLLSANSDYSSMWNYRKNAFSSMSERPEEEVKLWCNDELLFLASCLRNNPKSYGCWHHRCFIILNMPTPDWKKELDLCNQFLQFDDRNFHCWDYRRFVVKNSVPEISVDDEIKCTDKLVASNFSNYSSWHYRSKLLPKRFPSLNCSDRIGEEKLLEELELVQNAFFTDPNDQSAWFYHRWLLGRGQTVQGLIASHTSKSSSSVTCVFRKPYNLTDVKTKCSILIDDIAQDGDWNSLSNTEGYQHVWVFMSKNIFSEKDVDISLKVCDKTIEIKFDDDVGNHCETQITKEEFRQDSSSAKHDLLLSELESCIELNDLEPGNKWVILTLVLLMRAIDPMKYQSETNKYLGELQSIDSARKGYYADLRSKYFIEDYVTSNMKMKDSVNFSNMGLSRVCHLQYFSTIQSLRLSDNHLRNLNAQFSLLVCCVVRIFQMFIAYPKTLKNTCFKSLTANDNEIDDISGIKNMQKLQILSLRGNCLSLAKGFQHLSSCPELQRLDIERNLLKDDAVQEIEKLFPNIDLQS